MIHLLALAVAGNTVLLGVVLYLLLRSKPNPLALPYNRECVTADRQAAQIVELTSTLVRMRRDGYTQSQVIVAPPARQGLPSDVMRALEAVGEPGLEEDARRWLDDGMSEQAVIDQILEGGSVPLL
jgi:hypothetical protein